MSDYKISLLEIEEIISEINQMRLQWKKEIGDQKGVAWPKSIKNKVLELLNAGVSRKNIAYDCKIPYDTIGLWSFRKRKKDFNKLNSFHEITINENIDTKNLVTVTKTNSTNKKPNQKLIKVKTPKGYEFSGLSQVEFFELIRCLGGLNAL